MMHLPASVRVYLCLTPCDMRKSFDGLHALVREHLELDAFAGHLFVFASRQRDSLKILYWDRDGFAMWSKRLEDCPHALQRHSASSYTVAANGACPTMRTSGRGSFCAYTFPLGHSGHAAPGCRLGCGTGTFVAPV